MYKILVKGISVAYIKLSILVFVSDPTLAQNTKNIQHLAQRATVQINTNANPGGSGVIVKRDGPVYTVLTANHVVCENLGNTEIRCRTDFDYTVRTHDGKEYPIKQRQSLQKSVNDPDLAIVTFESQENYQIASLGNSEEVEIQSDILVAGFPTIFGRVGKDRTFTITNGKVVTFIPNPPKGYGLVYNATTFIGNSGGPVFDSSGNVIGIHGLADTDAVEIDNKDQSETRNALKPNVSTIKKLVNPQVESGTSFIQKTGFNAGIPINVFLSLVGRGWQVNNSVSDIKQTVTNNSDTPYNPTRSNDYQSRDNQDSGTDRSNMDNALAYIGRGNARYDLGDKQGAIVDYNQAIQINPNYADAYIGRGNARYDLGDKQGAIVDYNQAIQINPNYALAYNNRGNARYDLGDKQGAIVDYNQAIQINPNYALAYNNRGNARSDLGDKQGAIVDYNQAIQINPNYALAYNNRGNARYDLGDKQGAIVDYNQAIQINPNDADAYYNRGNARSNLGDKQGAIVDYNQAIQINPNDADAYYNRGLARYDLGDKQGAIVDYNQAIQINPNDADAYYNRGNARSDLGDKQGAIGDFQTAARLYQQQGNSQWYQYSLNRISQLR
ncbi:tetratricopeptide repeat protein [Cylindrospermopsis raciborskii]|uniref:tetratricopeptide repeat protein n=1 Tax=Cylindrospermopsis raciborskii TaxID=77022 RepID=UPI003DA52B8F